MISQTAPLVSKRVTRGQSEQLTQHNSVVESRGFRCLDLC
jgi:hypothetical protein